LVFVKHVQYDPKDTMLKAVSDLNFQFKKLDSISQGVLRGSEEVKPVLGVEGFML